jgi:hypothetical protein
MMTAATMSAGDLCCRLLLGAFLLAVTCDPVVHAVAPHDDCQVCAALSNRMAPAEPAPEVSPRCIDCGAAAESAPLPSPRVEQSVPFGRGPPAS